jgi:hypothetical protein
MSEEADILEFLEASEESITTVEDTQDRILGSLMRVEAKLQHLENRIDLLHDQVVDGFRVNDLRLKRVEANGNGRYALGAK